MTKKSSKETQESLVANMQSWQKVENAAIVSTGRVIEKTENPIVRLVMEIIQRDSQMHYRVQEWIAESLESRTVSLTPEDMSDVWGMIEDHIAIEQRTIKLAQESLNMIKDSRGMTVQAYLLEYLLADESKHEMLLGQLGKIQKGMYPYG